MSSTMHMNLKTTTIAAVALTVVFYGVYSVMSGKSASFAGKSSLKTFGSWKMKDFVEIPNEVKDKMSSVKIDEHHMTLKVADQDIEVFSLEVTPAEAEPASFAVLLLHGAAYTSKNWEETQTLQLLGALGHRAVAVDLPGWGKSKGKLAAEQKVAFLAAFIEQEKLGRPVLVSPSMSGSFSIPFLLGDKAQTCTERVRGFVPVAPVGTDAYTFGQYHKCEAPTMIVYGTKDANVGLTSLNNLRNLANMEMFPIEGVGHPAYMEKPEEWRRLLYNYMLAIELFKE